MGQPELMSGATGAGERRLATVVFLDITGFSGLCEQRDAEQVTRLLNGVFARLVEVVELYDGFLDKFIGDAAMVVFGAPKAHEDDAVRAAAMALQVVGAMPGWCEALGEEPLAMHAGIATGVVIAGRIGAGEAARYTVLGDAMNVAARLLSMAEAGEVLLAGSTEALLRGRQRTRARGEVPVRGRTAPVSVFLALPGEEAPLAARSTSPFVGRAAELGRLRGALAALAEGRGGALLVQGPAGVGKSRLVAEALAGSTVQVHAARARAVGSHIPYQPWREVLVALAAELGVTDLEPLSALLGQVSGPGGGTWRDAAHAAVQALFRDATARSDRVLVFDDHQWSDRASLVLLASLARMAATTPLLVLAQARSEGEALELGAEVMSLGPLSEPEVEALLEASAGDRPLPEAARAAVVQRSAGLPLYVEELARLGVPAEGDGLGISPLQALLTSRIDQLPAEARARLELAAVHGTVFEPARVDAMAGGPAPEVWAGLVATGVLDASPGGGLGFRQVLLQEALYARLLRTRREALHSAVAEHIAAGSAPDRASLLALHLGRAGRHDEAAPHWLEASRAAASVYALEDALAHVEQVFRSPAHRLAALRARSELYRWQGRLAEAVRDLDAALAEVRSPAERVDLLQARAVVAYYMGDGDDLRNYAEAAVVAATELGEDLPMARAWRALGVALEFSGRYAEAVRAYRQIEAVTAGREDPVSRQLLSHAYNSLGEIARALGRYSDAMAWYERSLAALALGPDAPLPFTYLGNLAAALYGLGRLDEARARLDTSVAEARRQGWREALAEFLCVRASVHLAAGERVRAREDASEAAAMAEALGQAEWRALSGQVVADIDRADGQLEAAEAGLRRSLSGFEAMGKVSEQVRTRRALAALLREAGREAEADEHGRVADALHTQLTRGLEALDPAGWVAPAPQV